MSVKQLERLTRRGKKFVLVPLADYQRMTEESLPPLPPAAADGSRNAVDHARASIARTLIRQRRGAGLSQAELARLAGVRQETISRIESGKHTPTVRVMEKLERVLQEKE